MREPYNGDSSAFAGRMALVLLGTVGLDLFEHAANAGHAFAPDRTGLDHLALAAASLDELNAWASRLDSHGVTRSPIRETDAFGSMFDFRDPDGIQLEFFFLDLDAFMSSAQAP
jgi:glyoxylase I family protein